MAKVQAHAVANEVTTRIESALSPGTMVSDEKLFAVPLTIKSAKFPQFFLADRVLMHMNNDLVATRGFFT